ncbi:tyrosine-protein phosphatase non-receptor type 6 [Colletotrichum karsti]|uniref:Tyrosine-protein phosphatase non-receptor type 6 n=1 Tax=Colletotrichum karsti TaxID=1095194 RepID=A0A9P6I472_9PEZI|nr:tyrosine-protein phosphatase non-receptor type 6 [Colletotrichum karsti]KAF9875525.1 tyrosine-protein phosphatase non-receptor type 6 [Colletotrichum karsti]
MSSNQPYVTIRSRRPHDGNSVSSADSTVGARVTTNQSRRVHSQAGDGQYGSSSGDAPRTATHDTSRVSYHVKHLDSFVQTLEDSANRAFPNRGRSSQRYKKVQALLLHWGSDDLFVLPELEDLERCLREDYAFDTEIFPIPSENSHLELMMQVGKLIKDHEAQDTLFLVYYGGHARIDESRQSTWCATRHPDSPWLQWSAIQTLLERSASDVLILLDCCAGAASATFPNGNSITETISASSWDAIAPDPGRYSFTNALIEVLQEWRLRAFSAAMLHAEVLARLKHPRPITINGKLFEARSTPVHFMMTSNHKAPSIEMSRILPPEARPPSPPQDTVASESETPEGIPGGRGPGAPISGEPNEDTPHVMISLALEDNQQLDLNAWEQWLSNFPAMAKYVKVQGVFKSHSTLLLLSMPVMVWDLLPENHATSFIAFIRSNNMMLQKGQKDKAAMQVAVRGSRAEPDLTEPDSASMNTFFSDTTYTYAPTDQGSVASQRLADMRSYSLGMGQASRRNTAGGQLVSAEPVSPSSSPPRGAAGLLRTGHSTTSLATLQRQLSSASQTSSEAVISRTMIPNQQRSSRTTVYRDIAEPPKFSQHVETLLQQYYQQEPLPNDDQKNFVASNLGIELWDVEAWFHHRRERDVVSQQFQNLKMGGSTPGAYEGAQMILPHHLNRIIEILTPSRILLIDLRSPTDFERSHINGAINLRAPLKFIQDAPFDMIERAFPDEPSRQKFGQWQSAVCMVVYARAVDSSWECPVADVLYQKFKSWGWPGRCFVLKGHYREFSVSYSASIVGSKTAASSTTSTHEQAGGPARAEPPHRRDNAQKQTESRPSEDDDADAAARLRQQYDDLLTQIDSEEGRVNPSTPDPTASPERAQAMGQHERDLEAEFRRRVPDLYRKALDSSSTSSSRCVSTTAPDAPAAVPVPVPVPVRSDGSDQPATRSDRAGGDRERRPSFGFDTKAPFVEYLDRGLSHIRQGKPSDQDDNTSSSSTTVSPPSNNNNAANVSPGLSKLAAEGCYFDSGAAATANAATTPPPPPLPSDDSYVKISRGDAQLASDPGLGGKDGTTKDVHQHHRPSHQQHQHNNNNPVAAAASGDETPRRGRGGFLNKVLRRA